MKQSATTSSAIAISVLFSLIVVLFVFANLFKTTNETQKVEEIIKRANNASSVTAVPSALVTSEDADWHVRLQRTSLRAIERRGIGYEKGYSSLDMLLAPFPRAKQLLPLVDLRGHHLYTDQYATNVGIVGRYIPESSCYIWGANIYYDFRQGKLGNYHQLGLGAEILGKRWDARINIYLPIEDRSHSASCLFINFVRQSIAIRRKLEYDFAGWNAEVGRFFIKTNQVFLYGSIGPYFLTARCDTLWGARGRIRAQYTDYVALELSASQDHVFKTNYQAEIIFSLPVYSLYPRKHKRYLRCVTERQIYQPVQRFEIIPLKMRQGCSSCCQH